MLFLVAGLEQGDMKNPTRIDAFLLFSAALCACLALLVAAPIAAQEEAGTPGAFASSEGDQAEHATSRTLTEALMTIRANNGFYDPQQLPIVDALIEQAMEASRWRDVDNYMHLYLYLAQQSFAVGDDVRTDAVLRFTRWKNRNNQNDFVYEVDLLKINNTIKQEITQLEQRDHYQGKAFELTQLQLAYSEYLLARVAKLTTNSRESRRKARNAVRSCVTDNCVDRRYYATPEATAADVEAQGGINDAFAALSSAQQHLQEHQDGTDKFKELELETARLIKEYNELDVSGSYRSTGCQVGRGSTISDCENWITKEKLE